MNNKSKEIDFLIIGQGLAGSLLGWMLHQRGARICIVDDFHKESSSIVAAGIINPITGRRLVKSWMVDELLPAARNTYRNIEEALSCTIYEERVIYRALKDIQAENQWDERSGNEGYSPYMGSEAPTEILDILKPPFSWGAVHKAAQVNLPEFLRVIKDYFMFRGEMRLEDFDYGQLDFLEGGGVRYHDLFAKQMVFCEGQRGRFNPWFGHLPFVVSKGEMLEIELEGNREVPIIKHRAYLAPFGTNRCWVGATYEWHELDEKASDKAREQLVANLEKSISGNYKVIRQLAAIRPTVKDRRPFLGTDSKFPFLHIFNGLGTKGTSLGPFWGRHFVGYLLGENDLDSRVDIGRFEEG